MIIQILWEAVKIVLREKFINLIACLGNIK
jgi:hypothetical protein